MFWTATVGVALFAIALTAFLPSKDGGTAFPSNVPWAGRKKQIFASLRARCRELSAGTKPIKEGYEQYSKKNQLFILPGLTWCEVLVPPSQIQWLVSQPESVLSVTSTQDDLLCLRYLAPGPFPDFAMDFTVIRRDLTRQLNKILPDVVDELCASLDREWGLDDEQWVEKRIDSVEHAALRTANRVFFGKDLAQNEQFLQGIKRYHIAFAGVASLVRLLVPRIFMPLAARLLALPVKYLSRRLSQRSVLPMMNDMMPGVLNGHHTPDGDAKPNNIVQWMMYEAAGKGELTPSHARDIAAKAIFFNLFAVQTISFTMMITLTSILTYADAAELLAKLRAEADTILPKILNDPTALREMVQTDSVIREAMRFHPMTVRALSRDVVQEGGLRTPDGTLLPQGTRVGTAAGCMMRDPEIMEGADRFEPMRFVPDERNSEDGTSAVMKRQQMVNINEHFLSFGLGKHACPGRFFAAQVMKLLLALMVTRYDIEPLKEPPKFFEIADITGPPGKTKIKVKRRTLVEQ